MWSDVPGVRTWFWLGLAPWVSACTGSGDPASPPGDAQTALDAAVPSDGLDAAADAPGELDAGAILEGGHDSMRDADLDAMRDAAGILEEAGATPLDAGTFTCSVEAPTACPDAGPRYGDVAPIFRERCVICHAPTWNGPWPLDAYQHVADWQDTIRTNLLDCTMPPPEAGVPITRNEREQILTWIRCGLPM